MTIKKPSLSAALREASRPTAAADIEPEKNKPHDAASERRTGRDGLKTIGGFFDPAVSKQLRIMAVEHDSTVQDLLSEALNDLFVKHGKSPIA
ncbi:MAG TPA: ribbon-helix-helix domain-containing protein [Pirellulales bacterium]|jgi:hypothetical protein